MIRSRLLHILLLTTCVPTCLMAQSVSDSTSTHKMGNMTGRVRQLDEVVIVGYGRQRKGDVSGAVTTVRTDDMRQVADASFNRQLEGLAAGLQVSTTSGEPGGGVSLRIRGGSSIEGGNEPLYVIDGFPVYSTVVSASAVSGAPLNPLSMLASGDIASITVLKDAAATAIYGSRAANGVIIVTTKSGQSGKPKIAYQASVGVQTLAKRIDLLDARQFASLRNEALYDANPALGAHQYLSADEIAALGGGTDWQREAFRSALTTDHHLSVSGGTRQTRYHVSGNYYLQEGILRHTDFSRLATRVNLQSQLNSRLATGINLSMAQTGGRLAPEGIITSLLLMPPTATVYDKVRGGYTLRNPFENIFANPIASLLEQTNTSRSFKLLGTAFAEYTFLPQLKLKVMLGVDYQSGHERRYIPSTIYEGKAAGGIASVGTSEHRSWLNENTLTYTATVARKHRLEALLGLTQQETKVEWVRTGASNFVSDKLSYNNLESGAVVTTPYSYATRNALISTFARLNYQFDHRYFLTASLRADGSSRFGAKNKWGWFPSVGASWDVSRESFFGPISHIVSQFKLRTSYGLTGNQEIGNEQSLATLSAVAYQFGGIHVKGFAPDRVGNGRLGWESTSQFDLGLDIGLWNNRFSLSLDYYHKRTRDLLLNVEIPWTSGFQTSLQNYGTVVNRGFELALQSHNEWGKMRWDADFNFSLNRNKVVQLGGNAPRYISGLYYILQVGQPLGTFYGAATDGILQPGEDQGRGALTGNANPKAGDRLYRDVNGDGKFTVSADRTIIGSAQPDFICSLSNRLAYGSFDVSFMLTASVGNDVLNLNRQALEVFSGQQNAAASAAERWTTSHPSLTMPRAKLDPAPVFSDRSVEGGSYLRVRTVTLGYTLPAGFARKLHIGGLRWYVSATNLLTLTGYSGYDPAVTTAANAVDQATDLGIYPTSRTCSIGFSLQF